MPPSEFHGNPLERALNIVKRLQQHRYSDVSASIAQKAMSSFNLQPEDTPHLTHQMVNLLVYPQNPFISAPQVRRLPAHDVQPGLVNGRVRITDSRGVITMPDEDGHYLYAPGTPQFDQINAFYYTTFTLRMFERYAHRPIPWSFPSPRIDVDPYVGNLANAFYSEQDQMLGFHTYIALDGQERSTAQSADIVTHEAAHAVLDGVRDLYNESFGLGARAFHESFGDITAILVALHDDSLIQRLFDLTGGDLRTSNFISEIAEYLAASLQPQADHATEHSFYLRNAFNQLVNRPFDELPYKPDDPITQLGRQEHNYSRLMTGAVYDTFVSIYEHLHQQNHPVIAIHRARDVIGQLVTLAIEIAPIGEVDFSDIARAILTADVLRCQGCYQADIIQIFAKRRILTAEEAHHHINMLAQLPDIRLPSTINNALASAQFLENVVLPALELTPERDLIPFSTYRNGAGQAFMSYFEVQPHQLDGEQFGIYNQSNLDIFGGLTLMFDANDRLCSVVYRPVSPQDVRQITTTITEFIEQERVVDNLQPIATPSQPTPKALHLRYAQTATKLIKYPVIYDDLPQSREGWRRFLPAFNSGDKK